MTVSRGGVRLLAVALSALLGCAGGVPVSADDDTAPPGPSIRMDFTHADGFWAAPFPSDHRVREDGTADLSSFPNPDGVQIVDQVLALLDGRARGAGTTSGVFLRLEAPPTDLPALAETVGPTSPVVLVDVDPASGERGRRFPIEVRHTEDPGPLGAPGLLSVLPLQGVPLRPGTRYAAAVEVGLPTAGGPLAEAEAVRTLRGGHDPEGLSAETARAYREALGGLSDDGFEAAALAVFTTGDPAREFAALVAAARGEAGTLDRPFVLTDVFDDYCVFESTVDMPVFQAGDPPYLVEGGGILFEDGVPRLDHLETARLVLTVPRAPAPLGTWPTAVFVRTGGGGDRPLVDRGPRAEPGAEAIEPGTGPALHFARAGMAGASVDGPLGGLRNPDGLDEQFLVFNVANPEALRDNVRQSAAELALVPAMLSDRVLDASACPGASPEVRFEAVALMGHSMGATIGPLTLAEAPEYRAAVFSGCGGSYIENVVWKESPIEVRPIAEWMLGYDEIGLRLTEADPFLSLLQWAGEVADPPPYAEAAAAGRDVLVIQGIVDTYILPPMANAASLSLGLGLAGSALDGEHPELAHFTPLDELLPLVGSASLAFPASSNHDGDTRVVVQHAEDGIEDGHEVAFQLAAARHQYRCFLADAAAGRVPTVREGPADDAEGCD